MRQPAMKVPHQEETIVSMKSRTASIAAVMITAVLALVGLAMAQDSQAPAPTKAQLEAMKAKASALGLPDGVIQLTPCVPGMGEHWANPANMPFGPIYGVMGDQVVFVEIMPSQADFAKGMSWTQVLMPVAGKTIDHVDFQFEPHGHEGYLVPHYDIHAYFVPHSVHEGFCPAS